MTTNELHKMQWSHLFCLIHQAREEETGSFLGSQIRLIDEDGQEYAVEDNQGIGATLRIYKLPDNSQEELREYFQFAAES